MSELIDREETVKQIVKMGEMLGVSHDRDVTIAIALFVQDDKSAFPTVERSHGAWEVIGRETFSPTVTYRCSVCKAKEVSCVPNDKPHYCENCGADMMREGEVK